MASDHLLHLLCAEGPPWARHGRRYRRLRWHARLTTDVHVAAIIEETIYHHDPCRIYRQMNYT